MKVKSESKLLALWLLIASFLSMTPLELTLLLYENQGQINYGCSTKFLSIHAKIPKGFSSKYSNISAIQTLGLFLLR